MLTCRANASARGFTLVEMAIVMAVLAFLLFMAAPGFGTWIDNTRIRSAAQALQAGIQTARMEALRRNQPVSFYLVSLNSPFTLDNNCALSSSSGSWVVSTSSPAGQCASAALLAARPIGDAATNVQISAGHSTDTANMATLGSAATTLTYDGLGRVANASSAINRVRVTGPRAGTAYVDLMLIVDAGGGVRMCDPRASIASTDPRKC